MEESLADARRLAFDRVLDLAGDNVALIQAIAAHSTAWRAQGVAAMLDSLPTDARAVILAPYVAAERERCAQLCETANAGYACAAAIRALE